LVPVVLMKQKLKKEIVKCITYIVENDYPAEAGWFPMGSSFDAVIWGYNHPKTVKKLVAAARETLVRKRRRRK